MIDEKLCDEGLQRFARTADGTMFYLKLQKVLIGLPSDSEAGALRENFGRRKFAAELMAVMAEAMKENSPSDDASGSRPIIFTLAKPVSLAGGGSTRGARRRVSGTDPGNPDT